MIFYNNVKGVVLVIIIFHLILFYYGKYICRCDNKNKNNSNYCYRKEILGVQYSHFIGFILLGLFFPSYFWTFQIMGVLWELLEILMDKNENYTIKLFGGCLSEKPKSKKNSGGHGDSIYNFNVYKDTNKYLNPIDKYFNIKNSKIHFWHGSIAEIIPNVLGFWVGVLLNKFIF